MISTHDDRIFVLCPAELVTGGAELLHQLVDLLRSGGRDASIIYLPFGTDHHVPDAYRFYTVHVSRFEEISRTSIVVVPEVYAPLLSRLPTSNLLLWWLSVDNFQHMTKQLRARRLVPDWLNERLAFRAVRRSASLHLYQSEYARLYAEDHDLGPLLPLSDYLSPPYIEAARSRLTGQREDLLVYNPAKGLERTEQVLKSLNSVSSGQIKAVAIRNMSRAQVMEILSRAKLYIDFGEHPGKDRLPREAAALGCCILVNRRGSAANATDVPIPLEYKIDDFGEDFAKIAADIIFEICADFEEHEKNFDRYRQMIAQERERFVDQAEHVFGSFAINSTGN